MTGEVTQERDAGRGIRPSDVVRHLRVEPDRRHAPLVTGSSIEDSAALGTREAPFGPLRLGFVQKAVARGGRQDGYGTCVRYRRRDRAETDPFDDAGLQAELSDRVAELLPAEVGLGAVQDQRSRPSIAR